MALAALIRTVNTLKQCNSRYLFHSKETVSTVKGTVKSFCNTSVCSSTARKYYEDFFKVSLKKSVKLKLSDGVPKDYTLIYLSPLEQIMRICYPVMLISTVIGPSYVIYHFYKNGMTLKKRPSNSKLPIKFVNPELEIWIFVGAMFVFAATFCAILIKTPFRLYKHNLVEQKYIGIFQSVVPIKTHQFHFKSASQTRFKNPLLFFFRDSQYLIDSKKVILFYYCFRTPADLCDMLGVD